MSKGNLPDLIAPVEAASFFCMDQGLEKKDTAENGSVLSEGIPMGCSGKKNR